MKVVELFEASITGRRQWRHHGEYGYGLRIEVTKEQRTEIVHRLSDIMRRRDGKTDDFGKHGYPIIYSAPEQASTFPCDIRFVVKSNDERYDKESLPGQMIERLLKSAIRKVLHDVLGVPVKPVLEKDEHANGLRYVDMKVGWADEAR